MNTNQSIHQQRILFAVAAIVGVISAFLPWVSINVFGFSQSVSGINGDGKLTLAVFAAVAVLAFIGQRQQSLSQAGLVGTGVLGAIAVAIPIYNMITFNQNLSSGMEAANNAMEGLDLDFDFSGGVGFTYGFWLTVLAGVAIAGLAVYFLLKKNKGESSDLPINTDAIGKAFTDGANVVKAAGTAASQAIKETVEEQKAANQEPAAQQPASEAGQPSADAASDSSAENQP